VQPVVTEQKVHFKMSEPSQWSEKELREAFEKQDFLHIEVLSKPAS
jgi:hypothetical protein